MRALDLSLRISSVGACVRAKTKLSTLSLLTRQARDVNVRNRGKLILALRAGSVPCMHVYNKSHMFIFQAVIALFMLPDAP